MFFCHFGKLLMNILNHFNATVFPQCLLNQSLKGFLLISGGERKRAAQQLGYKTILQLFRVLGIIESTVNIAASIRKSGEKEACFRKTYHPIANAILKGVFHRIVG